jgi:hypothetical protein
MIIIAGKNKNLAQRYYANLIDYLIFLLFTVLYRFTAFFIRDFLIEWERSAKCGREGSSDK